MQIFSLPLSHCDIFIHITTLGQHKISSNIIETLCSFITQNDLRKYWITKKDLNTTSHQIEWELCNKSLSNMTTVEQRWWCKHVIRFCGVGSMLVKYKCQSHDNCSRCGRSNKTTARLLQCKGFGVDLLWQDEINNLTEWMSNQNLHPELQTIGLDHLRTWRNH